MTELIRAIQTCIGDGVCAYRNGVCMYRNRVCMYRNGVCTYWEPKIKPPVDSIRAQPRTAFYGQVRKPSGKPFTKEWMILLMSPSSDNFRSLGGQIYEVPQSLPSPWLA